MKKIFFNVVILLSLTLVFLNSTNANEVSGISKTAQKIVLDSKFVLLKQTKPNIKWAMIKVSKNGIDEQVLTRVEKAQISMNIYLRNGAGTYDISIFESSSEGQYNGSYYGTQTLKVNNTDTRDMSFLLPSNLVQSDNEEIINLANSLTQGSKNELESLKRIHTYVATNVKYDYDSYYDGTYAQKPYDAVGMMKALKGVCSGYANLYAALLRVVGIRTKVIQGTAYLGNGQTGSHAWNEVFIDNKWQSVDVTWDSTTNRLFKYFLIAEEEFSKDHQKEKEVLEN